MPVHKTKDGGYQWGNSGKKSTKNADCILLYFCKIGIDIS